MHGEPPLGQRYWREIAFDVLRNVGSDHLHGFLVELLRALETQVLTENRPTIGNLISTSSPTGFNRRNAG